MRTHAANPEALSPRASAQGRAPWFITSCCPPSLARTLAQIAAYVATRTENAIQLIQFMPTTVAATLAGNNNVEFAVETNYPHDSSVRLRILKADHADWEIQVRIPHWALEDPTQSPQLTLADGTSQKISTAVLTINSSLVPGGLAAGAELELTLPMNPRWTYPDYRVDAVRGCVAVEQGPLVMCAESVDQEGEHDISAITIDPSQPLQAKPGIITAAGAIVEGEDSGSTHNSPQELSFKPASITLIPYYQWANRGPSTMRVWIPIYTNMI